MLPVWSASSAWHRRSPEFGPEAPRPLCNRGPRSRPLFGLAHPGARLSLVPCRPGHEPAHLGPADSGHIASSSRHSLARRRVCRLLHDGWLGAPPHRRDLGALDAWRSAFAALVCPRRRCAEGRLTVRSAEGLLLFMRDAAGSRLVPGVSVGLVPIWSRRARCVSSADGDVLAGTGESRGRGARVVVDDCARVAVTLFFSTPPPLQRPRRAIAARVCAAPRSVVNPRERLARFCSRRTHAGALYLRSRCARCGGRRFTAPRCDPGARRPCHVCSRCAGALLRPPGSRPGRAGRRLKNCRRLGSALSVGDSSRARRRRAPPVRRVAGVVNNAAAARCCRRHTARRSTARSSPGAFLRRPGCGPGGAGRMLRAEDDLDGADRCG